MLATGLAEGTYIVTVQADKHASYRATQQIKAGTPQYAFYGFAVFYAVCLVLNWWFYLRKGAYVQNP
mgnify:CR=1 FL=1